jgi:hypothetical protein
MICCTMTTPIPFSDPPRSRPYRDALLQVLLTHDERELVREMAERDGMKQSPWVRQLIARHYAEQSERQSDQAVAA